MCCPSAAASCCAERAEGAGCCLCERARAGLPQAQSLLTVLTLPCARSARLPPRLQVQEGVWAAYQFADGHTAGLGVNLGLEGAFEATRLACSTAPTCIGIKKVAAGANKWQMFEGSRSVGVDAKVKVCGPGGIGAGREARRVRRAAGCMAAWGLARRMGAGAGRAPASWGLRARQLRTRTGAALTPRPTHIHAHTREQVYGANINAWIPDNPNPAKF